MFRLRNLLLLVIAIGLIGAGVAGWLAMRAARPSPLVTVTVAAGPVEQTFSGTGPLSAVSTVQVGCQVSGSVAEIKADFNSHVKAKSLLARIDDSLLSATLEQTTAAVAIAEADLAGAEANLESAHALLAASEQSLISADANVQAAEASLRASESSAESTRASLAVAQGNLERSRASLRQAELTRERTLELFSKRLTSSQERDQAVTDAMAAAAAIKSGDAEIQRAEAQIKQADAQVKQAAADLARTRAAREQAKADIAKTRAGIRQNQAAVTAAHARLKQANAQKRRAQVDVDFCQIRSPIDGVVVSRVVDVGQTVNAGFSTPVLFTLAGDLSQMQVEASVNEGDIGKVQPGRPVRFRVDAHPEREFPGTVRQVRLNPKTVNNVVEYTVVVDAANPDGLLLPGMTADVTFEVARKASVLRVPNAATRFQPPMEQISAAGQEAVKAAAQQKPAPGVGRVWIEDPAEPGKVAPVAIRMGLRDSGYTEVLEGLHDGQQVVTAVRRPGFGQP